MRLIKLIYSFIFLLCSFKALTQGKVFLSNNGVTDYSIYISGSSDKEKKAAAVLQEYLQKISGASFNIVTSRGKHQLFVLTTANAKKIFDYKNLDSLQEDGVLVKSAGEDLLLAGSEEAGLENAVYEFLEKFLSCHYYAHDAVEIPVRNTINLSAINYFYVPPIKYRYVHYNEANKGEYAKWNKLTNVAGNANEAKFPQWGLWVHSAFILVPPDKYFNDHPEYYALRNGKRVKTQLCLSNPAVEKIATESLAKIIAANPYAKYFSVSQMDNSGFCECEHCMAIAKKEESQSGPVINFVNNVAGNFPDKIISTLAYSYSRKAPLHIKPAPNVNIFFCANGANRAAAFVADKSAGSVFSDLAAWKQKTTDFFFWDYIVDYEHLLMPFPVYNYLQSNIQFLLNNHIDKTFQQGWAFNGAEMSELKCYLLSKLLWDPTINIKTARSNFLNFYYGPAGQWIAASLAVFDNYLNTHKIFLGNYDNPFDHADDYLSPEQIQKFRLCMINAARAVKGANPVYANRVEIAKQSLRYVLLEVSAKADKKKKNNAYYLSLLDSLRIIAGSNKMNLLSESSINIDDYYKSDSMYINDRNINNLLTGARIKMAGAPSIEKETRLNQLTDGMKGNRNTDKKWVSFNNNVATLIIDAGKPVLFDTLKMDFIHDPSHLILLPESVKVAISENEADFKDAGTIVNIYKNLGVKKEIKPFLFTTPNPVKTRYIKITIKMINTSSYIINAQTPVMLCDEIIAL